MKTLKIGLLLDDKFITKYAYELIHWAELQPNIKISHVITYQPPKNFVFNETSRKGFYNLISNIFFRKIISIERKIIKLSGFNKINFNTPDLSKKICEMLIARPTALEAKFAYEFSPSDAARVRSLNLDLLISYSSTRMSGEILNASRLGIISFDSCGNQNYRGDPACFWECYYRHPKTGFVIRKLAEEFDAEEVLLSGFFSTKIFFSINQENLYRKSNPHFQNLLQRIAITDQFPRIETSHPYSGQFLKSPKFHHGLIYIFKIIYRISKKIIFKSINFKKKWGLSFIQSNWKKAALWRSVSIAAPKGHFWADPFVYAYDDKTYCFIEDYLYKTDLGYISVLEIANDTVIEIGACIKEPFHLSFPFLFKYNGNLYMCPECSASRQIRIYQCENFPLAWKLSSIIMENVSAADTMLFEYAGIWWMLTNIDESGVGDHCSALYLFYSNSPLGAEWKPHPQNPVRIDSEGGRNAGLIFENGKIFRLAQRQGYDQYGEGLLVYEIIDLSELVYKEQLFSEINHSFKKRTLGTHHLSTTGKITVLDHVSYSFFP